ncbi:MAG TPA: PqqD family protein [Myxococcaceae bacterium]|nr:PqqD family protein [Myxococcaceae bacterium]
MRDPLLSRPKLHPDIAMERVSGRLMAAGRSDLLHIFEDEAGERSEVGERVVELSDGQRTVEAIIGTLCEEFEVDRDVCARDVSGFVEKLVELEILTLD